MNQSDSYEVGAGGSLVMSAGTSATQVIGHDPLRCAVMVCAPAQGRCSYSNDPNASLDQGIVLHSTQVPLEMTADNWGDFIRKPIYVVSNQANNTVGFAWSSYRVGG